MVRWTLALYPRAWRARYGGEVASLSEELIAEGDSTPWRAGIDLIAGAAVERGRALARSRRIVVVPAVAVLVATAGTGWALTRPQPPSRASQAANLASIRCVAGPPAAARAIRGWVAAPAPAWSSSTTPGRPGRQPGRPQATARQARVKPGRCIAVAGPCQAIQVSPPPPPAGARAVPGRLRPVQTRLLPASGRLRPVPQVPVPGRQRAVPGWIMLGPGRCIMVPPACWTVIPPHGAIRASRPPGGPGWIPAPPVRKAGTLRPVPVPATAHPVPVPATARPVPGPAVTPAIRCVARAA